MTSPSDRCGEPTPDGPCALPPHRRGWHDPAPPVIRVPRDTEGRPRVSVTQLRRYGTVDLTGTGVEPVRGCPRAYALTYGNGPVPETPSPAAERGLLLHRALACMDRDDLGPEDALMRVWGPSSGGPGAYAAAREILLGYLERDGPVTRYATIGTELDLSVPLYTDEEYGQVMFRGIVDSLAVDPIDPSVLHVTDVKSGARPVAVDALRTDVQLKAYVWMINRYWLAEYGSAPSRVVAHLDLLRHRDVAIEYTAGELEDWHAWAVALTRTILRDRAPAPILNDGCTWCPVRWSCPAWRALPAVGESLALRLTVLDTAAVVDLMGEARRVDRLLGAQLDQVRGVLEHETRSLGELRVGDQVWSVEDDTKTAVDVLGLVRVLLPEYPEVFAVAVTSSRARLVRACGELEPSVRDEVLACVSTVPGGETVKKRKAT